MKLQDGVYKISNAKTPSSFLTMDATHSLNPAYVFGYPWTGRDTQHWQFTCAGNTVMIRNVGTSKYLGIKDTACDDRTVFGTNDWTRWSVDQVSDNVCRLYVDGTQFNLDLAGYGDPTPGTRVSVWGANCSNRNQCWVLELLPPDSNDEAETPWIQPGNYLLVNQHNQKVLDLSGDDHRSVITYPLHGEDNQQWYIEHSGDGYTIRSVFTGKYLTGEEGISDGAALIANGFPVSWKVVVAAGCSFPYVRIIWPSHRVAVGLADPTSTSLSVQAQLQNSTARTRWQQWRLVPYPPRTATKAQDTTSTQTNSQTSANSTPDLIPSLAPPTQKSDSKGSTIESVTVTVTEDEDTITTTRTTTSTATVVEVSAKKHSDAGQAALDTDAAKMLSK